MLCLTTVATLFSNLELIKCALENAYNTIIFDYKDMKKNINKISRDTKRQRKENTLLIHLLVQKRQIEA